ncbi:hypothetical protein FN846DRAFT_908594 [Sphaerosporella brunnea]|uniref:Uncharacterized protein n=1 Tax=Sphaerosporella brunnea TaxID=1250544 RepID=A0A5J5EU91_9PEZI|nr:hypothetical protein FN846DRAFT_908594 [Sphaerosporella brunnea]
MSLTPPDDLRHPDAPRCLFASPQTPTTARRATPQSYPSPPRVFDRITRFLHSPSVAERDLAVQVSQSQYHSKEITRALKLCELQRRRYSYNPATCTLRLYSMVRPVHQSIAEFVSDMLVRIVRADWLDRAEEPKVNIGQRRTKLPTANYRRLGDTHKPPAWEKDPDACFNCKEKPGFPTRTRVVFELGFSESYVDLVNDAHQWLLKSPHVQLVVLIKITEDRATCLRRKKARKQQINEFVWQFGNEQARERLKQSDPAFAARGVAEKRAAEQSLRTGQKRNHPQDDDVSDMSLYEAVEAEVTIEDWVGPLDVFMEFWRLHNGKPEVDGSRMQILPATESDANPAIRITDLIASPIGPDDRQWPFDIAAYRTTLEGSQRELATWRALDYCRPRKDKREAGDDDLFKTEFNSDAEEDETDGETTPLSGDDLPGTPVSGDDLPGGDAILEGTRRSKRLKRDVALDE